MITSKDLIARADSQTLRALDWLRGENQRLRMEMWNSEIRSELHCHARFIRRAKAIIRLERAEVNGAGHVQRARETRIKSLMAAGFGATTAELTVMRQIAAGAR